MNDDKLIGARIEHLRDLKGMSQLELSKRIGIDKSVMNRIESGDRPTRGNDLREHYQEPGTTFLVKIENSIPILNSDDYLKFYLDVPSHQVPAGKRNRLEWFDDKFEESLI